MRLTCTSITEKLGNLSRISRRWPSSVFIHSWTQEGDPDRTRFNHQSKSIPCMHNALKPTRSFMFDSSHNQSLSRVMESLFNMLKREICNHKKQTVFARCWERETEKCMSSLLCEVALTVYIKQIQLFCYAQLPFFSNFYPK